MAGSSSSFPDVGREFWLLVVGVALLLLQKCTWVAMLTQVPSVLAPALLRWTALFDIVAVDEVAVVILMTVDSLRRVYSIY